MRIGLVVVFVLWAATSLAAALWWLVRQSVVWVAGISGYLAWWLWDGSGPWALGLTAGLLAAVLLAWRLAHPGSFRPWWPGRSAPGSVACSCTGGSGSR